MNNWFDSIDVEVLVLVLPVLAAVVLLVDGLFIGYLFPYPIFKMFR